MPNGEAYLYHLGSVTKTTIHFYGASFVWIMLIVSQSVVGTGDGSYGPIHRAVQHATMWMIGSNPQSCATHYNVDMIKSTELYSTL